MLCKYSGAYEAQNYAERDNKKIITIWQLRFSMLYYTQQTAWEWGNGVSPTWCDHQVHVKAISCRFKSCYLHQAKIIRTYLLLETGSDLSFLSKKKKRLVQKSVKKNSRTRSWPCRGLSAKALFSTRGQVKTWPYSIMELKQGLGSYSSQWVLSQPLFNVR